MPYTGISYGGETLRVTNITKVPKAPGTVKQKVGSRIVMVEIPGRSTTDNVISIRGYIVGTNRDTLRSNLEALQDGEPHQYNDGLVTVDAVIPDGGLVFDDTNDKSMTYYTYSLQLVEYHQS